MIFEFQKLQLSSRLLTYTASSRPGPDLQEDLGFSACSEAPSVLLLSDLNSPLEHLAPPFSSAPGGVWKESSCHSSALQSRRSHHEACCFTGRLLSVCPWYHALLGAGTLLGVPASCFHLHRRRLLGSSSPWVSLPSGSQAASTSLKPACFSSCGHRPVTSYSESSDCLLRPPRMQ